MEKSSVEITRLKTLVREVIPAVKIESLGENHFFIDFGKAAFGTVRMNIPSISGQHEAIVHLGESLSADHQVEREPKGSIIYRKISQILKPGIAEYTVTIPRDSRNTGPMAIRMPSEIGEVTPFRYCELENFPFTEFTIEQLAVHYPFNETASSFRSSDLTLNSVWEVCKYTVKATTFCGLYVDGDRERIPYEGDAYINQLSHYCVDREYGPARATEEHLFLYPTWPTEWHFHMIFMAWADWMYLGDADFLERHYDELRLKTLIHLAREDGLISTVKGGLTGDFEKSLNLYHDKYIYDHGLRDLVDWPPGSFNDSGVGERDNHEMMPYNSVINAFHYRAVVLMSRIADALHKDKDSEFFRHRAKQVKESFHRVFFDEVKNIYIDGEGAEHSSLHSNMFALAFDLVRESHLPHVVDFVKSRGMACSVYGAQYLLEGLYKAGEGQYALELMNARHDRSWWNMIACGSTMTLEAWDWKYKNNLDWNHAWGAVPANILPRYLMGIRPLEPGYGKILIQPQPGMLEYAECRCPTVHGEVHVSYERKKDGSLEIRMNIPENTRAMLKFRNHFNDMSHMTHNGRHWTGGLEGHEIRIDDLQPGSQVFTFSSKQ